MEGLSSFAVYATAFASPAGSRLPNLLFELGGLGYLVALVGVVVALVPLALVIREERRRRMPASPRRARRNMVPAAGGSLIAAADEAAAEKVRIYTVSDGTPGRHGGTAGAPP